MLCGGWGGHGGDKDSHTDRREGDNGDLAVGSLDSGIPPTSNEAGAGGGVCMGLSLGLNPAVAGGQFGLRVLICPWES